jgi:hypothetical protein
MTGATAVMPCQRNSMRVPHGSARCATPSADSPATCWPRR